MRVLFSVLANALILYLLARILPYSPEQGGVLLGRSIDLLSGGWKIYIVGGVILGVISAVLRPILELIGLPFKLFFFGLTILSINAIILFFFTKIMSGLQFENLTYDIKGPGAFFLSVAIFTIFNTLYGAFFKR